MKKSNVKKTDKKSGTSKKANVKTGETEFVTLDEFLSHFGTDDEVAECFHTGKKFKKPKESHSKDDSKVKKSRLSDSDKKRIGYLHEEIMIELEELKKQLEEKSKKDKPDITKPYDNININPNLSEDMFKSMGIKPQLLDDICHHIENNSDMVVIKVFRKMWLATTESPGDDPAQISIPHGSEGRILLANFINSNDDKPPSLLILQIGEGDGRWGNTLDDRLIKSGCPLYLAKDFEGVIKILDRIKIYSNVHNGGI